MQAGTLQEMTIAGTGCGCAGGGLLFVVLGGVAVFLFALTATIAGVWLAVSARLQRTGSRESSARVIGCVSAMTTVVVTIIVATLIGNLAPAAVAIIAPLWALYERRHLRSQRRLAAT